MSKLRHPHIVQFLGVCYFPGSTLPSLVMERVETNLHEMLETTPNLPLDIKRSILLDVARGLLYLHSQSPPIIHRDLTARNVLLNSAMMAKIADLGVARFVDVQPHQLATMTQGPGNIVYMPPEAIGEHARYNSSLDVFSFGHLALFTLTQEFIGTKMKAATYIDSNTQKIIGRSEIERREHGFRILYQNLGDENAFVKLTQDCLQNIPNNRPSVADLVNRIEMISLTEKSPSKLDLMAQLTNRESEVKQLKEQACEKDDHIATLEQQVVAYMQQISASQQEIERKENQLRELQEQLNSQEDQIGSIEGRLNKLLMQVNTTCN